MNSEMEYQNGCSEEFAELCALSTSGELSPEELALLGEHVARCVTCAALLKEYTGLATVGMAKLAALQEPDEIRIPFHGNEKEAEDRFVAAFRASRPTWRSMLPSHRSLATESERRDTRRLAFRLATAAVLLSCVSGAFEIGRRVQARSSRPVPVASLAPLAPVQNVENARLKADLATAQAILATITAKSDDLERQLVEFSRAKKSLETQIDDLTKKDTRDTASLASASLQRDSLQQQLNDTSAELVRAREDLTHTQRDRQDALFRVATLETEVHHLNTELASSNNSVGNDEKFLAADRDIRELMGARQLYIADVFDVQNNGDRSKPFGRVFYTKGRSLIFYAFDLQSQPGYREAKTFQAWGKPDSSSAKPISLGVFFEDSEKNHRWVVKSDNPEILAQINSVFVTVEPHGGSNKPSGKPFLEAYLHSLPPNHP